MSYTPTPWRIGDYPNQVDDSGGALICDCDFTARDSPLDAANAQHIVKCVNTHDELVAALKECADRFEKCCQFSGSDPEHAGLAVSAYRTLLAKATA